MCSDSLLQIGRKLRKANTREQLRPQDMVLIHVPPSLVPEPKAYTGPYHYFNHGRLSRKTKLELVPTYLWDVDASLRQHFRHACPNGQLKSFLEKSIFLVDTRKRLTLSAHTILRERWHHRLEKFDSEDQNRARFKQVMNAQNTNFQLLQDAKNDLESVQT